MLMSMQHNALAHLLRDLERASILNAYQRIIHIPSHLKSKPEHKIALRILDDYEARMDEVEGFIYYIEGKGSN